MAAPIETMLEMIALVFKNTIGTMAELLVLLGNLSQGLAAISGMGAAGFLAAVIALGITLLLLGKFFLSSWKLLAALFVLGFIALWLLMAGSA